VLLYIGFAALAIVLFVVLWVGVRGLLAKNALDEAVPAASSLAAQVAAGDREAANVSFSSLSSSSSEAAALTSDPIWRVAELIPYLGSNLTAVREASAIVNDISRDAVSPIIEITSSLGVDDFVPVAGAVQLQPLINAQPKIAAAADALESADTRTREIETDHVLEFVANAIGKLESTVGEANVIVGTAHRAATLIPPMMGAEGERTYLLLFQNPAELRATGGIPGALAQLNVSDGAISLSQQASSADFPMSDSPVLELPLETRALYGDITGKYMQDVNLTPQFPLSAALAAEMWRQQFGVEVDGVMSVDPMVLSYLLRATGPIALPTGDELTSENAVQLLLTDVYARYPDPVVQDLFFASAAAAVFDSVSNGALQPSLLLDALARAGSENRIFVWSTHGAEQSELEETTLAGVLPASDAETTRIGVYFNDATGSKMGTYLKSQINTGHAVCRTDGLPQIDVAITLTNTAPADAAASLPEYVTGAGIYGVPAGNIRIIANVYGVPGSANLGIEREGVEVPHHSTSDSGYPVSAIEIELAPGESKTFTSSFLSEEPGLSEIVIQKTPEINILPFGKVEVFC